MNGVIYARYSTGPNQTDQSIEGQLRECKEYAKANNIKIVGIYVDKAKTGTNDNRSDFQRMLSDSKSKIFDYVIVWKIDRFGRNREDIAKNKAILRRNNVSVLSAKEHIPDGPEGIILEGLLESLAEYYSAELREKINRGMRESAFKCQFNGSGLAPGYYVDKEHKYHIDEDGASIVHLIFDLYDGGMIVADVLRQLNDRGIKTMKGKEFTHTGITRILRNRQYIGEYRWKDIIIPGGIPRIISDEQFDRVQKRLKENKRAPSAARGGDVPFLLTGKIFCLKCKGTMIGDSGTGRHGEKHHYYTCRTRKIRKTCDKLSDNKSWLEREVVKMTAQHVLQDDVIEYIADRVAEILKKEHDDKSIEKYLKAQLSDVEIAINNIMKAIEAGIITETTGRRLRELEAEREDIQISIDKERIEKPLINREQIVYFLRQFKGGDINDVEYQRKIIDMFVNKIYLGDDKIIIVYNYSGENNKIAADIVEEAAEEALSETSLSGSDMLSPAPP